MAWLPSWAQSSTIELITRLDHELRSHGVSCQLEVVPGIGHEFPDDFGGRLRSGLRFLLG